LIATTSNTSYDDTQVVYTHTYTYKIKSVDRANLVSGYSPSASITTPSQQQCDPNCRGCDPPSQLSVAQGTGAEQ
jgi:hypothetical protein